MGGTKWTNAIAATNYAIDSLNHHDRVGIVCFGSSVLSYDKKSIRRATATRRETLKTWLGTKSANSGTNIFSGLQAAFEFVSSDEDSLSTSYVNQIVLITDGQGNGGYSDEEVQQLTYEYNVALSTPASLFAVGITADTGSDWVSSINYPLLRALALQNDGFEVRLKQSNILESLSDFLDVITSPVLASVEFEYNPDDVYNLTTTSFPTLYRGTDLVVAGKVRQERLQRQTVHACTDISIFGITFDVEVSFDTSFVWDEPAELTESLSDVWAYLVIRSISADVQRLDFSADQIAQLEAVARTEALNHDLVTPWTSMLVVDYGEYDPTSPNATTTSSPKLLGSTTSPLSLSPRPAPPRQSPSPQARFPGPGRPAIPGPNSWESPAPAAESRPGPSSSGSSVQHNFPSSSGSSSGTSYYGYGWAPGPASSYFWRPSPSFDIPAPNDDYLLADSYTAYFYYTNSYSFYESYEPLTCAQRLNGGSTTTTQRLTTTTSGDPVCMCGTSTCDGLLSKVPGSTMTAVDKNFGCECVVCISGSEVKVQKTTTTVVCSWWNC